MLHLISVVLRSRLGHKLDKRRKSISGNVETNVFFLFAETKFFYFDASHWENYETSEYSDFIGELLFPDLKHILKPEDFNIKQCSHSKSVQRVRVKCKHLQAIQRKANQILSDEGTSKAMLLKLKITFRFNKDLDM
ncbi:CLUMA_CG007828, isoform A [Clunio marinus]|uniref:CLUMA_CG007828, isoform A n=1 Tax=Clunio marinus TaxID=568069 RepID=A0A1J1I7B8_9DIPT|nr:CLUMA_CG007828, isoform A [Clunio marinus]